MNKNLLKNYKLASIEKQLKNSLVFFYNTTNINSQNKIKTEQEFVIKKIKSYQIHNNLTKIVLKKSIFLNSYNTINGLISFILVKNCNNIIKKIKHLLNLNQESTLIAIKFNNKIYSPKQLTNLKTLEYKKNVNMLNQKLKRNLKHFYYITAKYN